MRNMAIVVAQNRMSFRDKILTDAPAFLLFGNRLRRVRQATLRKPAQTKAMVRIAQGKPTFGARYKIMRGKMMPPMPPAVHAMPVANARRRSNQWPMAARLGLKRRDADAPPTTLKDRKIW